MEINEVCSLGSICFSSNLLRRNKLRGRAYPFDWLFSSPEIVAHCIEDKFVTFLDKSQHIAHRGVTQHAFYKDFLLEHHLNINTYKDYPSYNAALKICGQDLIIFRHHNLLDPAQHETYTKRCEAFMNLLDKPHSKLFAITAHSSNIKCDDDYITRILNLDNVLNKHTTNYRLLSITYTMSNVNSYTIDSVGDVDFLQLQTVSRIEGSAFLNNCDNIYLNEVIQKMYTYNLLNTYEPEQYIP